MGMAMHLCMPVCAHNWVQTSARNYVRRRAYMCANARMHLYGCMHMRLEKRDLYDWKMKDDQKRDFYNRKKKDYQKRDFI